MTTTTTSLGSTWNDWLRQALNLTLSVGVIVVTLIGYATGANSNFDSSDGTTSPVVPAAYAFSIWGPIYAAIVAYGIYQALPRRREDGLLRGIGWYTASAFLGTSLWLVAAQSQFDWLTVVCMVWILGSLALAFNELIRQPRALTSAERYLVLYPISVFLGWITVATIANVAEVLRMGGVRDPLMPDQVWAMVMLLIGAGIAAHVIRVSRGNVAYALTIVWAYVAVMVANVSRTPNPGVVAAAVVGAGVVLGTLWWVRRGLSTDDNG